jgi:hypothetical protein
MFRGFGAKRLDGSVNWMKDRGSIVKGMAGIEF